MEILRHTDLRRAAQMIQQGDLLIYPTDTVWGMGCDATNPAAVARLKTVKGKPADAPLIWLLPSIAAVEKFCGTVTPTERRLLNQKHTSVVVHGQAVRVVKSGWLNRLLTKCGVPLVATSANHHGQPVITGWRQALTLASDHCAVMRGRKIYHSLPSTLLRVSATNPPKIQIIRHGSGISMG